MVYWLAGLCAVLLVVICLLMVKIILLRRAAEEIRLEFKARLASDTNTGIDITSSDRTMRRLAGDVDRQLKLLRREQLRCAQGDRELKDAITSISHDLRTPLTAICGYLELLEREELAEPVRKYLHVIANRTAALTQLTEELFEYSIVISANRYSDLERVNLNEAVEESVAAYYGALKERGIRPSVSLPDRPVVRKLNREALSRVLGNLISNALKYSDGDLIILLSEEGMLTVQNQAKRLDEVSVGRLFDRFYTVETGQRATGLGLSIAKNLTEQMGGTLCAKYQRGQLFMFLSFEHNTR